jgi:hypothetical protein
MKCAVRNRLWAEFKARVTELNGTVDRISSVDVGVVFNEAVMTAQQASRDCDRAQLLWEEHMREHMCDVQTSQEPAAINECAPAGMEA